MSLAVLALQAVGLVGEVLVHLAVLSRPGTVGLPVLDVLFQLLFVHLGQGVESELNVGNEGITPASAKVFSDYHTHHLQTLSLGSHGVSRDDPATLTQLVGNSKLVKLVAVLGVKTESDKRETSTVRLRHEQETELLHRSCEIIGSPGQIEHD